MIASFRRLSKSKLGTLILVGFLLAIIASFAMMDIQNVISSGFGGGGNTLAKVGSETVSDREMARAMERRLTQVRQENPNATYATIAGDFEPMLASLIDQRAIAVFARKQGMHLSPALVGAEIANIPGTRGLDGRFSQQAYQAFLAQQRLTDAEVRELISAGILERLLLIPVASSARVPVGMASPYASMLLEARQGEVATIPVTAFRAGLNPTDADLQRFHAGNARRYMVPEQRALRIARIGPEQVANVAPTDQEIAAFYNANRATYAPRESRMITHVILPDENAARQLAARARSGDLKGAAGDSAVAVGAQTREQYAGIVGAQAAGAVFGAGSGTVVGPVRSDLGWIVAKVEGVQRQGGKTLDQARAEIAERLTAEKRQAALSELVTRIEDEIAEGANFTEAAAVGKLQVVETPPLTAGGVASGNPGFRLPPELRPALRTAFEMAADDDPEMIELPNNGGFVLVAPAQVIPAAPAPLAAIRDQVREDWIAEQASAQARAVASAIAAKADRGVPLAQAIREAGTPLPPVQQVGARRLQLSQMQGQVPPALRMLFTLGQGKSRLVADPQGRGFSVVKVNRIVPGNALTSPGLISRVASDFRQPVSSEYAQQFLNAIRKDVGITRNEEAIAAYRRQFVAQ